MLKHFSYSYLLRQKCRSLTSMVNKRHLSVEDKLSITDEDINTKSTVRQNTPQYESTFESINKVLANKSLSHLLKDANNEQIVDYKESTQEMVRRDQSRLALRPKTAPEDTTVILFPGQGSQFVGMGYNVIESSNVKQMFSIAKQILGYDLLDLCLNGPIETLNKTQYCQPAIYVTSLAAVECLRQRGTGDVEACVATAGFSVGELSALVFAGAMSFEDGLRLVKIRAESMQYASELVPSAMITVFFNADARISFACNAAREWCVRKGIEEKDAICNIANYLFPHCKVIAGHEEAINFLEMNAKDFGIKRSKRLPVSGAFHTKLMEPARKVMAEALRKIHLEVPLIPVHSNFDAKIYKDVVSMRKKLAKQIVSPVHWEQILHIVYDRPKDMKCPKTFECGPGKSLLSTLSMVHAVARRSAHHISV